MNYYRCMFFPALRARFDTMSPGSQRLTQVGLCLLLGALLVPGVIYVAGITLLGRYEGASLAHLYGSVFAGLRTGNAADWLVVLGPVSFYGLWLVLSAWWRRSRY